MTASMDGFINFYKATGIASNKALDGIKRVTGQKKAGFLGTLDPIAAGILPVGLGFGTRFFPYFETMPKTYRAVLVFGAETDTQDGTGQTVREAGFSHITRETMEAALQMFRGEIDQVPPMYSAKKVDGKRLYEIARKGGEVERKPKKVTIHTLTLDAFGNGTAELTATVSTGTYIRTLCEDIGRALNSAAHMGALVRSEVHNFREADSWTIERLQDRREQSDEWLLPLDYPLMHLPALKIGVRDERMMMNGQGVSPSENITGLCRVYTDDANEFVGLGNVDRFTKKLMPERLVSTRQPRRYGTL